MYLGPMILDPYPTIHQQALPDDPRTREEWWIMEGGDQTYSEFITDRRRWLPAPPPGGTGVVTMRPVMPPNVNLR